MQAWTDSISSPESEQEEVIVQAMSSTDDDIYAANVVALQNFASGGLSKKTFSAAQIDSLHFAQALALGLTPFAADTFTQVSILSLCARKAVMPSPISLHVRVAQNFSFVSIIAGKRAVDAVALFSQPPRKVARLVEILDEEPVSVVPDDQAHGLALALHKVDLAASYSPGPPMMPLTTNQVRRSPRANKYDGFKVTAVKDVKVKKSKVRAIVKPQVVDTPVLTLGQVSGSTSSTMDIPPPTPIPIL